VPSLSLGASFLSSCRARFRRFAISDIALGGTLVVLTPWLAPVVVIAVSAIVAIATVVIVSREYGTTLRSLLADAEALSATQAVGADGALRWMIVEDLADALDANAKTLRFKGYLVTSAIALLILSVLLILAHNP
jgi:hypothetical protein